MFSVIQTPISYNVIDCLTYETVKRFPSLSMAVSWLMNCDDVPSFDLGKIYNTEFCL